MTGQSDIPKVEIRPVQCLQEGWELVRDRYWLFLGICVVGVLLGSAAPMGILVGPMFCGVYICLLAAMRGQEVRFAKLFDGFNHFMQSFLVSLILTAAGIVIGLGATAVMMVLLIAGAATQNEAFALLGMLFGFAFMFAIIIAFSLALGVLTMFAFALIPDRGMTCMEAIRTSVAAFRRNPGGLTGLVLLNWLLSMAGVLCCYVGAFFVMPVCFAATAVAYRKIFPDSGLRPVQS
jgi:uncharacterized membrane protein